MRITEVSEPEEDDFEVLKNGLNGFNELYTDFLLKEKVSFFVKDENNKTVGGILGEINWGVATCSGTLDFGFCSVKGLRLKVTSKA